MLKMTNKLQPYGVVPDARHAKWHEVGRYAIIHFSVSTFHDREWGYGDEKNESFNPTDFDAEQWARTCVDGGLKGIVLVAKHHDGFCLWPTKTTEHSVKNSPWRDGKGDMVGEVAEACRKYGLKFGVYCSPWDRNNAEYGREGYVQVFQEQVRELLTNYGELFEVWFDGANGGDGYYGGTYEKRPIDAVTYYGWDKVKSMIREHQPNAVMFPFDLRWIGNECGVAKETCWVTHDVTNSPGGDPTKYGEGIRGGEAWRPAECDFPLRTGWFYHEEQQPKSADKLLELYLKSIGRGCSINLGLAPDTRGRICDDDVKVLKEWNDKLQDIFSNDLAEKATCPIIAGNKFWTPVEDGDQDLIVEFAEPVKFNLIELSEYVELGQRVESFTVDYWEDGSWVELSGATSIGYLRLLPTMTVVSTKIRISFNGPVPPAISKVGIYQAPPSLMLNSNILVTRTREGMVKISGGESGLDLRYTLDGTDPDINSTRYREPFLLPDGGIIKVRGFVDEYPTPTVTAAFGPARKDWKIVDVSLDSPYDNRGEAAADKILDDDPTTYWHTYHQDKKMSTPPHAITIDMGKDQEISMVTMTPHAGSDYGEGLSGTPDHYEYQLSSDGENWNVIAEGEFANIKANPCQQIIKLPSKQQGRYLKFVAKHAVNDDFYIKVAGISAI